MAGDRPLLADAVDEVEGLGEVRAAPDPRRRSGRRRRGSGSPARRRSARAAPQPVRVRRCSRNRGRRRPLPAPARRRGCAPARAPGSARRPAAPGKRATRAAGGTRRAVVDDQDLEALGRSRCAARAARQSSSRSASFRCGMTTLTSGLPAGARGLAGSCCTALDAARRKRAEKSAVRGAGGPPLRIRHAECLCRCPPQPSRGPLSPSRRRPMILATPRLAALAGVRGGRPRDRLGPGRHRHSARARRPRLPGAGARERRRRAPSPRPQDLAVAENLDPDSHFEPHTAVARRLGGTSNLWAGRCLPFDPIDFRARPWLGLDGLADRAGRSRALSRPRRSKRSPPARAVFEAPLAAWRRTRRSAATRSSAGATCRDRRSATPGGAGGARTTSWWRSAPRSPASATARTAASPGSSCIVGEGRGEIPASRRGAGGRRQREHPAAAARAGARRPRASAAPAGRSGASTWATVSGQIADIIFENRALHDGLDYHVDAHGSYVRRRLVPSEATQGAEPARQCRLLAGGAADRERRAPLGAALGGLPRALGGAARPAADRRAGAAEACRRAALPARHRISRNLVRDLPRTLGFAPAVPLAEPGGAGCACRGSSCKTPPGATGSSTMPSSCRTRESRLSAAEARDRLGQRRLAIDLRFSEADAASVLRAHAALEAWLTPQPRSRGSSTTARRKTGRRWC